MVLIVNVIVLRTNRIHGVSKSKTLPKFIKAKIVKINSNWVWQDKHDGSWNPNSDFAGGGGE